MNNFIKNLCGNDKKEGVSVELVFYKPSERLPMDGEEVLCLISNKYWAVCMFVSGEFRTSIHRVVNITSGVSKWSSLPTSKEVLGG